MPVLDEVLAANEEYSRTFGDQERTRAAARAALRDPDLHGRPARPRQVRRPERRRRARHPQRRRPRQRRRDPLARDLLQAPRHRRVVRHPPHRLRDGVLHERGHGRTCSSRASRPQRSGRTASTTSAPGPARPTAATSTGSPSPTGAERRRRRAPDPRPSARAPRDPDLRLLYDVSTGGLEEVAEATAVGRAPAAVAGA